jgi:hypothetical protein
VSIRIRKLTPAQEQLIEMTQVWVNGHPRHLEGGNVTWVDGYWRNQRPGEDVGGKLTKPGTAYTAKERKARGIAFEPPEGVAKNVPVPGTKPKYAPGQRVFLPGSGYAGTIVKVTEEGPDTTFRDGKPVPGSGRIYAIKLDTGHVVSKAEHVLEEAQTPEFAVGDWVAEKGTGYRFKVNLVEQIAPTTVRYRVVSGFDPKTGMTLTGPLERFRFDDEVQPAEEPETLDPSKWAIRVPTIDEPTDEAARAWTVLAFLRDQGVEVGPEGADLIEDDDPVDRYIELDASEARWSVGGTDLNDPRGVKAMWGGAKEPRQAYFDAPDPDGVSPADDKLAEAHDDAARLARVMEALLGRKSRWTGRIKYDTEGDVAVASMSWYGTLRLDRDRTRRATAAPSAEGIEAGKLHMMLRTRNRQRLRILVHEMAHGLSSHPVGHDGAAYLERPAYEEGVVEGWTQAHLADIVNADPELRKMMLGSKGAMSRDKAAAAVESAYVSYIEYVRPLAVLARLLGYVKVQQPVSFVGSLDAQRAERADGYRAFFDTLIRIPLSYRRNALFAMAAAQGLDLDDQKTFDNAIAQLDKGKPLA